jgi:prophage antirepressor-like protein
MGDELIPATKIAVFRNKEIRKIIYQKEWWFSVVDVIGALTESVNPRDYWFKMKARVKDEEALELSTICRQLKILM